MFQCDCPPDDCAGKVALYLVGDRCAGDALARKFTPLVFRIVPRGIDRDTLDAIEQTVARFPSEWRQLWEWWAQGLGREEMAHRAGKSLRTVQYWLAEMLDQVRAAVRD